MPSPHAPFGRSPLYFLRLMIAHELLPVTQISYAWIICSVCGSGVRKWFLVGGYPPKFLILRVTSYGFCISKVTSYGWYFKSYELRIIFQSYELQYLINALRAGRMGRCDYLSLLCVHRIFFCVMCSGGLALATQKDVSVASTVWPTRTTHLRCRKLFVVVNCMCLWCETAPCARISKSDVFRTLSPECKLVTTILTQLSSKCEQQPRVRHTGLAENFPNMRIVIRILHPPPEILHPCRISTPCRNPAPIFQEKKNFPIKSFTRKKTCTRLQKFWTPRQKSCTPCRNSAPPCRNSALEGDRISATLQKSCTL